MNPVENTSEATIEVEGVAFSAHDIKKLKQDHKELRSLTIKSISDTVRLASGTILPGLECSELQLRLMANLTGTSVFEALFILDAINKTSALPGDVCEYGVATGRTSALIAATLQKYGAVKRLWLYDSFEGLPKPSEKDRLLHDMYRLGQIEKYQGMFAVPERIVSREIEEVGFPLDRAVIVKGWIETDTLAERSPDCISFCYLDMDFYQSTKDVLNLLVQRMPKGGVAIVDDYGFFTSGVETAIREIMAENQGVFSIHQPFRDKFAVRTGLGSTARLVSSDVSGIYIVMKRSPVKPVSSFLPCPRNLMRAL